MCEENEAARLNKLSYDESRLIRNLLKDRMFAIRTFPNAFVDAESEHEELRMLQSKLDARALWIEYWSSEIEGD